MNNWWAQLANLEDTTREISSKSVLYGGIMILLLTAISIAFQKREELKKPLFFSIAGITVLVSLILTGSTIYLNVKSESKGPVHWHADIEFWACDTEIGLRDPYKFLSNKVGTATYHEHNDKRIHLEGVVLDKSIDASLGKFLEVVGGSLTAKSISIPVNSTTDYLEVEKTDGDKSLNGDLSEFIVANKDHALVNFTAQNSCPDSEDSELQVYVYKTSEENDKEYYQQKITDPANYIIRDEDQIPEGDCVIFEFGPIADKTNKVCKQYGVRDIARCSDFGVTDEARGICQMTEIDFYEELNDA